MQRCALAPAVMPQTPDGRQVAVLDVNQYLCIVFMTGRQNNENLE